MALRDLGYRPYEGERLPPTNNTRVMLRHGLRRAWGSWLVKICAFLCWGPTLLWMAYIAYRWWLGSQVGPDAGFQAVENPATVVHFLYKTQLWLFITMVTLGAGASVISEDLSHRAFQFYFAKPVTPWQYLLGRVSAVGIWCFCLTFVPGALIVLMLTGVAPEELRLERAGLLLPALMHALLIAAVCATASVGTSALSKSRALTMSSWILLFVVPHILSVMVFAIGDWPWLQLASIPALLSAVGDALFKIDAEGDIEWFHALPVLAAIVGGSAWIAFQRLRHAEVIT